MFVVFHVCIVLRGGTLRFDLVLLRYVSCILCLPLCCAVRLCRSVSVRYVLCRYCMLCGYAVTYVRFLCLVDLYT
jgi:hypothetical protein